MDSLNNQEQNNLQIYRTIQSTSNEDYFSPSYSKTYTCLDNSSIIASQTETDSTEAIAANVALNSDNYCDRNTVANLTNTYDGYNLNCERISQNSFEISEAESSYENQQKEELVNLLKEWKLEKLAEHLAGMKAYVSILKVMKRHHIDKLLKPFDVVTQILFEHQLEIWRDSTGLPLSSYETYESRRTPLSSLVTGQPSPRSVCTRVSPYTSGFSTPEPKENESVKLSDILNGSLKGNMLCEYYNKHHKFTDDQRTLLVNIIAQYFDNNNLHLSLSTSHQLEEEIVLRFPGEKLEFYRSGMRGKIYNKFCNLKSTFKAISKSEKHSTSKATDNATEEKSSVPESNAESCIRSLKYDNLTFDQFDHCWKSCTKYRLNEIKQASSTLEILQKWPQYKLPSGYRLIDMDVSSLFKNSYSLTDKWIDIYKCILTFLMTDSNIKEKQIKAVVDSINHKDLTEDSRDAILLWALHGYLVPTHKIIRKDNRGKNSTTKFTIKDSQESFLLLFSSIQEVENHLEFMKKNGQNIQPLIIGVGEMTDIKEIYVYFDGIKYKFSSFIRAVDICFKTFHLFNLEYPTPSILFWTFLQLFFYKIKSNSSKKAPKVYILIQELENIKKNDETF